MCAIAQLLSERQNTEIDPILSLMRGGIFEYQTGQRRDKTTVSELLTKIRAGAAAIEGVLNLSPSPSPEGPKSGSSPEIEQPPFSDRQNSEIDSMLSHMRHEIFVYQTGQRHDEPNARGLVVSIRTGTAIIEDLVGIGPQPRPEEPKSSYGVGIQSWLTALPPDENPG